MVIYSVSQINIVHGEIADFLNSRSDERIKFYSIFKLMVLFIIVFRPAQ